MGASGARRAIACVGHELTGPLTALYTHLKLARRRSDDPSLDAALRCVDRLRDITGVLQVAGRADDEDDAALGDTAELADLIATAAAALGREVATTVRGPTPRVAGRTGQVIGPALRAVARTAPDGAGLRVELDGDAAVARVRIDSGVAPDPERWRLVAPLASARAGLELWVAALAALDEGGAVRVADLDGVLALDLELPAARERAA